MMWSSVPKVRSGMRTLSLASFIIWKACGVVTSWMRWRPIRSWVWPDGSVRTVCASHTLSSSVRAMGASSTKGSSDHRGQRRYCGGYRASSGPASLVERREMPRHAGGAPAQVARRADQPSAAAGLAGLRLPVRGERELVVQIARRTGVPDYHGQPGARVAHGPVRLKHPLLGGGRLRGLDAIPDGLGQRFVSRLNRPPRRGQDHGWKRRGTGLLSYR